MTYQAQDNRPTALKGRAFGKGLRRRCQETPFGSTTLARQIFSNVHSYLLKPLMRTSTVPAAVHMLGNKYASGIMSLG